MAAKEDKFERQITNAAIQKKLSLLIQKYTSIIKRANELIKNIL